MVAGLGGVRGGEAGGYELADGPLRKTIGPDRSTYLRPLPPCQSPYCPAPIPPPFPPTYSISITGGFLFVASWAWQGEGGELLPLGRIILSPSSAPPSPPSFFLSFSRFVFHKLMTKIHRQRL